MTARKRRCGFGLLFLLLSFAGRQAAGPNPHLVSIPSGFTALCLTALLLGAGRLVKGISFRIVMLAVPAAFLLLTPGFSWRSVSPEEAVTRVEAQFAIILKDLKSAASVPIPSAANRGELMALLDEAARGSPLYARLGLVLFADDGTPLAWGGGSLEGAETLPFPEDDSFVVVRSLSRDMVGYGRQVEFRDGVGTIVAGVTLGSSPAGPLMGVDIENLLSRACARRAFTVAYPGTKAAIVAYDNLFRSRGEVLRSGGFHHFPLRSPAGRLLAIATMGDRAAADPSFARFCRLLLKIIAALVLLWLWLDPKLSLAVALPACLVLALGLAEAGPDAMATALPTAILATCLAIRLASHRSAAVSYCAAIIFGLLAGRGTLLLPSGEEFYRLLTMDPWTHGFSLSASAVTVFLYGIVAASAWFLVGFAPPKSRSLALALAFGVAALSTAPWPLLLLSLLPAILWLLPERVGAARGGGSSQLLFRLGSLLGIMVVGPAIASVAMTASADRSLLAYLKGELRPAVVGIEASRTRLLRSALRALRRNGELSALAASRDDGDERAYALWLASPLRRSEAASALGLFDETGRLVGSFGRGLSVSSVAQWNKDLARNGMLVEPFEILSHTRLHRGLVGQVELPQAAGVSGAVRIAVATDPESLCATREKGLGRWLIAELAEGGRSIRSSSGEPVALPRNEAQPWNGTRLITVDTGTARYSSIAFLDGTRRFLIGLLRPPWLVSVSHAVGAAGVGGGAYLPLLLSSLVLFPGILSAVRLPRVPSYRLVLLLCFLGAATGPVLALRATLYHLLEARSRRVQEGETRATLALARRMAADFYAHGGGRGRDDRIAERMRRLLGSDLDIYEHGRLVASSRRQLVGLALRSSLLPALVEKALEIDETPFVTWRSGDERFAATSFRFRSPVRRAVIALPQREGGEGEDLRFEEIRAGLRVLATLVALLACCGALLLGSALGRPLTRLTRDLSLVGAGDFQSVGKPPIFDELKVLHQAMRTMAVSLEEKQEEISRRSRYIQTVLDRATSGVLSLDGDGTIRMANRQAERLLARPLGGRSLLRALEEREVFDGMLDLYRNYLDRRRPVAVQCRGRGESRIRAAFYPFEEGTLCMIDDISDVVRANRMEAFAEMARSVAHEIKNPLTPIRLNVEHLGRLLRGAELPAKLQTAANESIQAVLSQVKALTKLAGEFSRFTRKPTGAKELVGLGEILRGLARDYAHGSVKVESAIPDSLPSILGRHDELVRAFQNLVQNGYEACLAASSRGRVLIRAAAREDRLFVLVRDNGVGVPEEIRGHLFEPHFSTKEAGSGLGLALARRIFREHGGDLRLIPGESETVFEAVLPVAEVGGPALEQA